MISIGDKVRSIHSADEGIVKGIHKNNIIDIEIEDGFIIPFSASELVVVSASEEKELGKRPSKTSETSTPAAEKGIFLSLVVISDRLKVTLINNTDYEILGIVYFNPKETPKALTAYHLKKKNYEEISDLIPLNSLTKKSHFHISYSLFKKGNGKIETEQHKKISLPDHKILTKAKSIAPLINKEGLVFQIDEEQKNINSKIITQSIQENQTPQKDISHQKGTGGSKTVDLHIESLTKDFDFMEDSEKLDLQVSVFEKELDNAITSCLDDITFIHGIGAGTLRHKIQKALSGHPHVKFYEDADKGKFGYGATKATL